MTNAIVPILCYHAIAPPPTLPARERGLTIPAERFDEHLNVLEELGLQTVTVSELIAARASNDHAQLHGRVAITFDDGYADLLSVVRPRLASRSLTATAFVTTSYVDSREAGGADGRRWLSWSELRALEPIIEVGAHGHDHLQLDMIPVDVARAEITTCKDLLERRLGRPVTSFAYPYGYSTPAVRALLPAVGYEAGLTVVHACSSPADDAFNLPRLRLTGRTTAATLRRWLSGDGVRIGPCPPQLRTRAFRVVRRARRALRRA
ncbi:MAG TPA: polysaccharide deacetylase family protein [Acidimicrobiales bacterium]|jgi:peptidoglycan/xylan/chitin deacetylase (PgdA/CDA1 family)|nr:polysaccharide deacetylase family protein [Acidimicrobiales bacterium]